MSIYFIFYFYLFYWLSHLSSGLCFSTDSTASNIRNPIIIKGVPITTNVSIFVICSVSSHIGRSMNSPIKKRTIPNILILFLFLFSSRLISSHYFLFSFFFYLILIYQQVTSKAKRRDKQRASPFLLFLDIYSY